jgi:hypothetical protein
MYERRVNRAPLNVRELRLAKFGTTCRITAVRNQHCAHRFRFVLLRPRFRRCYSCGSGVAVTAREALYPTSQSAYTAVMVRIVAIAVALALGPTAFWILFAHRQFGWPALVLLGVSLYLLVRPTRPGAGPSNTAASMQVASQTQQGANAASSGSSSGYLVEVAKQYFWLLAGPSLLACVWKLLSFCFPSQTAAFGSHDQEYVALVVVIMAFWFYSVIAIFMRHLRLRQSAA